MKRGITLIELLLVFSLVAVLATGAAISFWGTKSNQASDASVNNLQTVLLRARIYARDGRDEKAWGVKCETNSTFSLIKGTPSNFSKEQDFDLEYPTRFLNDWIVWFNPGTGTIKNLVEISLTNGRGGNAKVIIYPTGLVEVVK